MSEKHLFITELMSGEHISRAEYLGSKHGLFVAKFVVNVLPWIIFAFIAHHFINKYW